MLFFFLGTVLVSIYLASSITRQLARRTKELALLRQKQENAYHQMRILYEVAKAVNSTLDLNDVLDTIVRRATMAMGAKAGSIRLLDDERRFLEISAAFGLSEEYLKKGKVDPQKGGMDRLSLQGKPVMVLDATSDPLFQYPEQARREGIRSVVSVPLMLQEAAIGVLRVYSGEQRAFNAEETEFLMALASQGAVAIQNARVYRHLQQLDEAKSKFVFTVTHDLKAPVAAVQTQFEVLQGGFAGELTPHQRQLIERAAMRLSGLQTLIGDLLALGALKGKLPAHRTEELDFTATLRKLCDTVRPEAEVKGVQLWMNLPDAPLRLQAAADEMERLAGNLLENAIKYTAREVPSR